MNEKFNKNEKVEQLNKVLLSHGEEKGLIVKDPLEHRFNFRLFCTFENVWPNRASLKRAVETIQ